jgi:hypothetical protein
VDASTNIYAATGFQIWRITPAGSVDSVAGSDEGFSDGPRLLSRFRGPQAAAIDAAGNLLVSDYMGIRKIRADGWVTTMAGTGDVGYVDGLGSEAQFNQTAGLCVDGEGNVYVADSGNHCIRKVSPAPDGPPRLQISLAAEQVILLWPVWAGGFALETSLELSAATIWTRVTNGVVRSVNNHVFTNRVGVATGYYRLAHP